MSSADGHVIGMTPIRTSGPQRRKWNLAILSDGYVAERMAVFAADAESVATRLLAEPPFRDPRIANCINIFRIDVVSDEAGADHPLCQDGGGTGTARRTFFDSTFCFDSRTQRLLSGDEELAIKVARQFVGGELHALVLVDDAERGGAGGEVGWFSTGGSDWKEVAIHELGHSAFKLADEYDYGGANHGPAGEPPEPNVTAERDPRRVKWRRHVTSESPVPTRANPNCGATDPGPSGLSLGHVGTFEGARYHHCGLYRPTWDCMMRNTNQPFCPVCVAQIQSCLAPFMS